MPVVVPRYTVDDLDRFPDDGNRYELLDGMLLVTPAPVLPHQVVAARILAALAEHLKGVPDVYVVSPGEVVLPPGNRLEPDVLVLRTASLAKAWLHCERLLAVEIMSPGSRVYDRDFKGPAYLALGVRECWRVDLVERTIATATADTPETIFRNRLAWEPAIAPRTLVLDLEEIFRDIP